MSAQDKPLPCVVPPPARPLPPIEDLTCCVCGDSTRGRQWWNRDRGYGLCEGCADDPRVMGQEDAARLYGERGIHYCVPAPKMTVCAYCGEIIRTGERPATHGFCGDDECKERLAGTRPMLPLFGGYVDGKLVAWTRARNEGHALTRFSWELAEHHAGLAVQLLTEAELAAVVEAARKEHGHA